jgi:hypothetical protein
VRLILRPHKIVPKLIPENGLTLTSQRCNPFTDFQPIRHPQHNSGTIVKSGLLQIEEQLAIIARNPVAETKQVTEIVTIIDKAHLKLKRLLILQAATIILVAQPDHPARQAQTIPLIAELHPQHGTLQSQPAEHRTHQQTHPAAGRYLRPQPENKHGADGKGLC